MGVMQSPYGEPAAGNSDWPDRDLHLSHDALRVRDGGRRARTVSEQNGVSANRGFGKFRGGPSGNRTPDRWIKSPSRDGKSPAFTMTCRQRSRSSNHQVTGLRRASTPNRRSAGSTSSRRADDQIGGSPGRVQTCNAPTRGQQGSAAGHSNTPFRNALDYPRRRICWRGGSTR